MPSMLARGNSGLGKSSRRFSLLGRQSSSNDFEASNNETFDMTNGMTRRNSMLEDPQVPSVVQLIAEDLSIATRSLFSRVTGDNKAPWLAPLSTNTHGQTNSSEVDNNNLSDEEEDDWAEDNWADGKEGERRGLGIKKNSDRRMSSPAMIWNNLRRRSSVLRSISDLSLPFNEYSVKSRGDGGIPGSLKQDEGSELERVESGESPWREVHPSDRSKRRKERELENDLEQDYELDGIKSGDGSSRPDSDRMSDGASIPSRSNSPVYFDRVSSNKSRNKQEDIDTEISKALNIALDDDEDGGVYVLDEGPVLLHEVVAAASLNSPLSKVQKEEGDTDPAPTTVLKEIEKEERLSNLTDDASVRDVIQALHDGRTVQRMESRDTDTRALSSDVKGLLKIDTDQPAGSGGDSALNFSQSSGKASKSSTIRNWPSLARHPTWTGRLDSKLKGEVM